MYILVTHTGLLVFSSHCCPELNTQREAHTLALPRGRAARVGVQVHAVPQNEALS